MKKILAIILTAALILTLCPTVVFAVDMTPVSVSVATYADNGRATAKTEFNAGDTVWAFVDLTNTNELTNFLVTLEYPVDLLTCEAVLAKTSYYDTANEENVDWTASAVNTGIAGKVIGNFGRAEGVVVTGQILRVKFTAKGSGTADITASIDKDQTGLLTSDGQFPIPNTTNPTASASITVTGGDPQTKTLDSIAITNQPKIAYIVGQTFSTSGLVVTAYYSDGTSAAVTGYTGLEALNGYTFTADDVGVGKSATISYTEDGVTETATLTYSVAAAGSFAVTFGEDQKTYNVGDTVTASVVVNGNGEFASFQANLNYDSTKLNFVSAVADDAIGGVSAVNTQAPDVIKFAHVGDSNNVSADGTTVATVTFTVKTGVITAGSSATTTLSLENIKIGLAGQEYGGTSAITSSSSTLSLYNLTATFTAGDHVTIGTSPLTLYIKHNVAGLWSNEARTTPATAPTASIVSGDDANYELQGWYDAGNNKQDGNPIVAAAWTESQAFTAKAKLKGETTVSWPSNVTITGGITTVGANDGKHNVGEDITFTVDTLTDGYKRTVTYTIDDGSKITLTAVEGTYTIPSSAITAGCTIEIIVTDEPDITVEFQVPGSEQTGGEATGQKMVKVTVTAQATAGKTYRYNGQDMYWSSRYNAYLYYVDSAATVDGVKAEITLVTTVGTTNPVLNYNGDVNLNNTVDVYDAQIAWDLYKKHANYAAIGGLAVQKRLEADLVGDTNYIVDTQDAANIIARAVGNVA
jgi:hypothetical protein